MEAAIARATMPVTFYDCDFEGVDLSRLDISGFAFERCTVIDADMSHIVATGSVWKGCRARKASLRGADLGDARVDAGDWNNTDWQGARISGMHIR